MRELADRYRNVWMAKTVKQVEKEIESYRRYFQKHKDCFFQECAPTSLSDGQRFNILRQILEDKKNARMH